MLNESVFIGNPVSLDISRSKFDLSHVWSGLLNAGIAVPCFAYSDVLPGDTFKISTQIVVRSTTPIAPVMDQLYGDIYYFFVPHKLTLGREAMSAATTDGIHSFESFIGAQDSLLNMPLPGNSSLPKVKLTQNIGASSFIGSFADYIGINGAGLMYDINITPFEALAYAKVWNDFFRDPNTMTPISYSIVGGFISFYGGTNNLNGIAEINYNNSSYQLIQPACRYHGYFGSALPWPQRNSTAVNVSAGGLAPVVYRNEYASGITATQFGVDLFEVASQGTNPLGTANINVYNSSNQKIGSEYADLSQAAAISVNAFRLAVQTQRWYEAIARSGNRLSDLCGLFGVRPHDIGSDTPEYLGGLHVALNMTQVANTAGTTYSTATQQSIGSTGAFSLTNDGGYICTKSFDTWGTIICILVIRPHESFSQGIHRRFFRDDRLKYYWPQFANLGEQTIENREIFANGQVGDTQVFGYQEAWAEYRMLPDVVTHLLRPQLSGNIGYWTYCNHFATRPTLAGYLNGNELYKNIDQTLQVPSSTANFQFMAQVNHKIIAVRPMPTYSIPGLVDHH